MFCPNRGREWKRVVGSPNSSIRVGYEVLFGRRDRPNYQRVDGYDPPALAWRSTLVIERPQPGTILHGAPEGDEGALNLGLLMTDINEEGTFFPAVTSASHGGNGVMQVAAQAGQLTPGQMGAEGGNLGFVDGSVTWRAMSEMRRHHIHQTRNNSLGWW